MIVFGWTLRGLTNFFSLALARSVGILAMSPLHCFIIVFSWFKCFYDNALTDLVNHYANRKLIVSCTKDYT